MSLQDNWPLLGGEFGLNQSSQLEQQTLSFTELQGHLDIRSVISNSE
jgi:hypothetical protein